jgi:MFS family permease
MTPADPMNQRNPDDATHDTSRLTRVVVSTVAVQAVIVMASLTIPVLAGLIGPAAGIPAYLVGYYSALIYGFAAATSVVTPRLFQRWGGIRLHQGILVMTATAMASLVTAMPILFVVSAVILGCAYGPMNPASTVMLARYTPARLRARIFSLKQTAVPAGGALAGFAAPTFATLLGWRGTMLLIAAICITVAALIQPWRDQLDGDSIEETKWIDIGVWLPVRVLLTQAGLRAVGLSSCSFGAVQFSFSSVFPTVLVQIGWSLRDAGAVLSFALIVGVIFRIVWGSVADRVGTRPILGVMGIIMSAAVFAAAFVGSGWPAVAVFGVSALFGLSAYCWAGIGIAEAVHQVTPEMVPAASAGMIGVTFLGALAGPALFSTATTLTGSFRWAFLVLSVFSGFSGLWLLRPSTHWKRAEWMMRT